MNHLTKIRYFGTFPVLNFLCFSLFVPVIHAIFINKITVKYSAIPSESIRSKVGFNLALAYEMNGNLNLAMEWCGKSLQTAWSYDKMAYLSVLEQRQKESEKVVAKRAFY